MSWIRALQDRWYVFVIALILAMGVGIRLFAYGDLRLSIGTLDTDTYLESAEMPLFTWDSFTSSRLLTTSIVFSLFEPPQGYLLKTVTSPGKGEKHPYRTLQPGFDNVVLFQIFLSILGWVSLALVFARHTDHQVVKVAVVILIVSFAFSPPIAGWDNVLIAESLSTSLFALSFALLIEIVFWVTQGESRVSIPVLVLFIIWFLSLFLWTFTKDINLYVVLVTLVFALPMVLFPSKSRKVPLVVLAGLVTALFALGLISSNVSQRWKTPLTHIFEDQILPHPLRVSFMQEIGMPAPDSPEFEVWFDRHAPGAYLRFLIAHPGYSLLPLIGRMEGFVSENVQPYYRVKNDSIRRSLLAVGNLLHIKSSAVFLVDLILLASLILLAVERRTPTQFAWAWLGTWLCLSALLTLFVSFHADTLGITRHVMGSILLFRLFFWLFLLVVIDNMLGKSTIG